MSARQDTAWSGGLLNRTGAPVEFSFATASDDIRYTVEIGGSEVSPSERLAYIDRLFPELGVDGEWGGVARRFHEIQRGASLQWGAWLGVRHERSGGGTNFKIYAERPAEINGALSSLITNYLGAVPAIAGGKPELRLLGASPGSNRCEFYFELPDSGLKLSELKHLLAHAGLENKQAELVELIRSFQFRREGRSDLLPEAQYGCSYSALPSGRDVVFSIFLFANDFAGGDGFLRWQLLAATLSRGWRLGCYPALTEPLAERYFDSAYHNMISFSVGEAVSGLQISLSPPPKTED